MIVDDSGSMSASDGNKIVGAGSNSKIVPCSRWSELSTSMLFHAQLSEAAVVKTEIRLLNMAAPIMLGIGPENDGVHLINWKVTLIIHRVEELHYVDI